MLTNSEKKVIIFIIFVLIGGSLAGFFRGEFLKEEKECVFCPVNINTATKEELTLIPHIGPVKAGRIIVYRDKNKGFKTKDEILEIEGIGENTFKKIENKICVEQPDEIKKEF